MARRGAGEGHIKKIKLKSGKTAYRAWLTVGYKVNEQGTRTPIRRTVQAARRDAVVAGLDALRAKYKTELDYAAEATMRCDALFEKWIAHFVTTTRPKRRTPETYRWAWNRAAALLGDPLVARVTPLQLQETLNALVADLKPKSIGLVRVVFDGMFGQAVLWRIRPDNPAAELRVPRDLDAGPDERRIISAAQAQTFTAALLEERLGLAVVLTYALAIRPGEAVALRVQDVDFAAGTVTVTATHNLERSTGKVERDSPKSRRGARVLPMTPGLDPLLRQQIARARNERTAMTNIPRGAWTTPDEGLLFVRETDGGRLTAGALYRVSRRIAEAAGLGIVGPRILRRSMLSLLASQGVDPKVRAAIGGHSAAMTEQHYHEVDPADVRQAVSGLYGVLPAADDVIEGEIIEGLIVEDEE